MRDRPQQILKVACLGLAALLLVQLARVVLRANPLAHVTIPALPALPDEAPAENQPTNSTPGLAQANKTTNQFDHLSRTNSTPVGTNRLAAATLAGQNTNANNHRLDAGRETNSVAGSAANQGKTNAATAPSQTQAATNRVAISEAGSVGTNQNRVPGLDEAARKNSTNSVLAKSDPTNTNPITPAAPGERPTGLPVRPPRIAAMKTQPLPLPIQARLDRITESEILGQVIHPLPMALLGIAGETAFLRAPSGQTGLVKLGENLGEIKLLRIGTNRVLVEQDGQEKELSIFSGLGGESLLSKKTGTANENTPK